MGFRGQILERRKDSRWIIGGLLALLLAFTLAYYLIQQSRSISPTVVASGVLLFVLWYVNIVLILAIVFVLGRNLFKLAVERRHRILGSKFKTKLVATYIGLSLLPVIVLFVFAAELLQGAVSRWFDTPAEVALAQGNEVSQALTGQLEASTMLQAQVAAGKLEGLDLQRATRRNELGRRLQEILTEGDLDFLAIYEGLDFVHGVVDPSVGLADLPEPDRSHLEEALERGNAVRTPSTRGGRLTLAAVALASSEPESGAVVVVGTALPASVAEQRNLLVEAYQRHEQIKVQKDELVASYMLTFLMVTLFVVLVSSWVGLYLARRITVPIQALAEGTRIISEGDLDYRVEVDAGDELGVLVDSFNQMTDELGSSRELLEKSNRELISTNQRLEEERALIAAVLDSVASGVISVDRDGVVLTCNGAASRLLQQESSALVGNQLRDVWTDPERKKLAILVEEARPWRGRVTQQMTMTLGGQRKSFEAKISNMRDSSGNISGRVMVLEDLTELIKAQQLAAWSEAARRIAHEIKNPLTPIKLSAERLRVRARQGDPDLGAAIEEGVAIISNEVDAMKSMVDEFSRFARMPGANPTEVDLRGVLEETTRLYEDIKSGVEVAAEVAPEASSAWLDGKQFKRALINLLDNAIAATESPGRVSVSAEKQNGQLRVEVADTGQGIPAEAKKKLFLPHFSTKGRGTGLGLAIVHRIVAEHQGTISVEDNAPQGTIFTIVLPQ